jgi:hypothetical protein
MKCTYPSWGLIEACLDAPLFQYNGARKIVRDVIWAPGRVPVVDLEAIGYARSGVKMKALQRQYFDPKECDRIRALMKRREKQSFTAVSMSMRAGEKDGRSMGHCIDSLVVASDEHAKTWVTVMYRSTEVIKKFTADLAFLPWVFEQLEIEPSGVSFFFSNAYLSGIFFPTLFGFLDPIEFLKMLRRREPPLFVVATRFLRRTVRSRNQVFPYSPEQHQHVLAWKLYPEKMKIISSYLETELERMKRGK